MRIKVARSARKHKIGNARILEALHDAGEGNPEPGTTKTHYYGRDGRGVELHIITIPGHDDADLTVIIHAMPTALKE